MLLLLLVELFEFFQYLFWSLVALQGGSGLRDGLRLLLWLLWQRLNLRYRLRYIGFFRLVSIGIALVQHRWDPRLYAIGGIARQSTSRCRGKNDPLHDVGPVRAGQDHIVEMRTLKQASQYHLRWSGSQLGRHPVLRSLASFNLYARLSAYSVQNIAQG